jgi:hypothetical protein
MPFRLVSVGSRYYIGTQWLTGHRPALNDRGPLTVWLDYVKNVSISKSCLSYLTQGQMYYTQQRFPKKKTASSSVKMTSHHKSGTHCAVSVPPSPDCTLCAQHYFRISLCA